MINLKMQSRKNALKLVWPKLTLWLGFILAVKLRVLNRRTLNNSLMGRFYIVMQRILFSLGCCHSSVDSSAFTILMPRVRDPSTPSTLFSFIVFVLYLSCEKNKNKQKEAGFGPFFKEYYSWTTLRLAEKDWAVVVARLRAWRLRLPIPDDPNNYLLLNVCSKGEKEAGNGPLKHLMRWETPNLKGKQLLGNNF